MKRRLFSVFLIVLLLCGCNKEQKQWQEQYDLGVRYLEDGDYEEAILAFTAAIQIDPKNADAYLMRGDAYVMAAKMEPDKAEEYLRKAKKDYKRAERLDESLEDEVEDKLDEVEESLERLEDPTAGMTIPADALVWGGHSYYLFDIGGTWEAAENYCQSLGGHLATITTQEENDALYNYICSLGVGSAYIGLTDNVQEGVWMWVTGEVLEYTNWHSGEPNNDYGGEKYAMFYDRYTDGTWNDGDFGVNTQGRATAFLCEWDGAKQSGREAGEGTLSGRICKASDRTTPVEEANVRIYSDGKMCGGLIADPSGNYSIVLPEGEYRIEITARGYISFSAYASVRGEETTYMETFLMVEGGEEESGTACGTIYNALTGSGVEDVTLEVRKGWNAAEAEAVLATVTTDFYGDYSVTLPLGNYTLTAVKEGYISAVVNIVVQKGTTSSQNGTVTPVGYGDSFRIVLTWGKNPSDLDSHVEGWLSNGDFFHVYYLNTWKYDGDVEVCNLDVDDTTSYGPETITLNATADTPYYYYVYRFYGSGTLATSEAQVKVYQGGTLIATFNVPTDQGSGDYWNVFAIVNGELIVRNTITSEADTDYAGG